MTDPKYKQAKVADLIPYARNSRTHSYEQITKIASSIREFGFLNPVIVDGQNGIIAGHGRVMAAQKLGLIEIPVLQADHLSDAQKRAYIIADNRLALDAGWDAEMLRVEFSELADLGFDLSLTGFDDQDFADIGLDEFGSGEPALDDEKYTAKIETPIYEIKGDKPAILEICDTSKTDSMIQDIKAAKLPQDVEGFLIEAAHRHTVLNYEKIAEFYAHQPENIRQLMRDSALVIIDYGAAIERGYVRLTKEMQQLSGESDHAA